MFVSLFYRFRSNGLKVSLEEWLTLMNGLQQGLHDCSLHGFYTLCRAVVVSSETDFDRFDQVFFEFFRGIEPQERLPEAMLQWLEHPELTRSDWKLLGKFTNMQVEEIETLFAKIIKMRNRIIHSYRVTNASGEQILATKERVKDGNRQFEITEEYLLNFIAFNQELSDLLHNLRGY